MAHSRPAAKARGLLVFLAPAALLAACSAPPHAPPLRGGPGAAVPLVSAAEQSGFVRTGRYDEVERLCRGFEQAYPGRARCFSFGTTPEGRPMMAIAASADGALDPEA